jgi:hypothetical protein
MACSFTASRDNLRTTTFRQRVRMVQSRLDRTELELGWSVVHAGASGKRCASLAAP